MTRNNQKKLGLRIISICIIMLIALYSKIALCTAIDPYENYDHDLLASYRKYNFQKTMPGFISQFVFTGKRVHLSPHDSTLAPYLEQRYSNLKTVRTTSIAKKENLMSEKEFTTLINDFAYPIEKYTTQYNIEAWATYHNSITSASFKNSIQELYRQGLLYDGSCWDNILTRNAFNIIRDEQIFSDFIYNLYSSKPESSDEFLEQIYTKNGLKYNQEDFDKNLPFCTHVNNQRVENYQNTANYLHDHLLNSSTNHASANTLIKTIHTAHKILLTNLEHDNANMGKINLGTYRKKPIMVFPLNTDGQFKEQVINKIVALCRKYDINLSNNKECDTKHMVLKLATKEERENFLQYKVGLTDYPRTIEINMNKFAKDFLEKINSVNEGILSPIAFSAWTHMTLVQIHPFDEGNGRIARLIANEILMHWNYPPVIIKNDDEYTNAIFRDTVNPGEFAQYWANSIVWTAKQIDDPETGLLLSEDQTPNNEL